MVHVERWTYICEDVSMVVGDRKGNPVRPAGAVHKHFQLW